MNDLFSNDPEPMNGAILSECGLYRYHLWRIWDSDRATLVFVMQNPSTADATEDDATIRKCVGFAKCNGFGSISVRNVFAYRATDERELLEVADPFGPENYKHLLSVRKVQVVTKLVLAWGNRVGGKRLNHHYTNAMAAVMAQDPHCLGTTKSGQPKHPLMVGYAQPLVPFKARAS